MSSNYLYEIPALSITIVLIFFAEKFLGVSQIISNLSDPFLTVLTGVLVFSLGHAIVKLAIEPIQEMSELRGKIAEDLSYFANKTTAPDLATGEERIEVADTYREKASLLSAKTHKIPAYGFWSFIGLVPCKQDVISAREGLFELSNKVPMNEGSGNYQMMENIKQYLDLDLE